MDFKIKLTIIFLILSVGIVAAYFIISGVSPAINLGNNSDNAAFLQDGIALNDNYNEIEQKNNQNLTETLGKSFFNQVQYQNPEILQKNPSLLSQGILSDLSQSSPKLKAVSDIKDFNLNISSDNSELAKKTYWENIGIITQDEAEFINIEKISEAVYTVYGKLDISAVSKLAGAYNQLSDDFINLSVPSSLLNIHKQMIIYYQNAEIVFNAMSEYPKDPVKGYFALEMMDALKQEEIKLENALNNI